MPKRVRESALSPLSRAFLTSSGSRPEFVSTLLDHPDDHRNGKNREDGGHKNESGGEHRIAVILLRQGNRQGGGRHGHGDDADAECNPGHADRLQHEKRQYRDEQQADERAVINGESADDIQRFNIGEHRADSDHRDRGSHLPHRIQSLGQGSREFDRTQKDQQSKANGDHSGVEKRFLQEPGIGLSGIDKYAVRPEKQGENRDIDRGVKDPFGSEETADDRIAHETAVGEDRAKAEHFAGIAREPEKKNLPEEDGAEMGGHGETEDQGGVDQHLAGIIELERGKSQNRTGDIQQQAGESLGQFGVENLSFTDNKTNRHQKKEYHHLVEDNAFVHKMPRPAANEWLSRSLNAISRLYLRLTILKYYHLTSGAN